MNQLALSEKEVVDLIKQQMNKIDDVKLHYTCKIYKIRAKSEKYVRFILALHVLGLPITTQLAQHTLNSGHANIIRVFHNLGDKNILVWKRLGQKRLEWMVSPHFLEQVLC